MRTRKSVRRCLLAATLAGTPIYAGAADKPSTDTATSQQKSAALRSISVSALKAVPQSKQPTSGIQPTQYQPGTDQRSNGTSTVNGELQRLFHKNGQSMPSMRTQDLPNTNSPTIRMVRHKNDGSEPAELSQEEAAKKPGLLKRFLNTFKPKKSGDGEESLTGQSAIPAVPAPPAIVFDGTSHARPSSTGNSVPARVTGYKKGNGQSIFASGQARNAGASAHDTAQPLIQQPQLPPGKTPPANQPATQKPRGSDSRYQEPPRVQVLSDDGFVDPFGDPEPAESSDAVLDLDSLIDALGDQDDDAPALSPPQDSRDSIAQETAAVPRQSPESETTDNPFTTDIRYADEPLSSEPTDDSTAAAPSGIDATDMQPARTLPAKTESEQKTEQSQSDFGETTIPETQAQAIEVPLLEREEALTSSTTPKETWTPSAGAVGSGRALAAPIELKPDPERLRQLSNKARREQQLYRIMSRTGQVGFKGFCPVVLRDHRELHDGRQEYRSKFGLKTYQFSSPDAKAAFEANPARYAPAGGGSDVVLLVNMNEEVAGILDFSLWYRDRLYMFRSRETQAIFSGDPERYASQY
ncbi:MAG: hypothetical protein P8J37_00820 [Fuerstiella sp.]|nr:hypothetical protein [Fuerstiella sp.]